MVLLSAVSIAITGIDGYKNTIKGYFESIWDLIQNTDVKENLKDNIRRDQNVKRDLRDYKFIRSRSQSPIRYSRDSIESILPDTIEMELIKHAPRNNDYVPHPYGKDVIPNSRQSKLSISSSLPNLFRTKSPKKMSRNDGSFKQNSDGSFPLPPRNKSPDKSQPVFSKVKVINGPLKDLPPPPTETYNDYNTLRRNDTTKSVLRTGDNYNKFLANVEY